MEPVPPKTGSSPKPSIRQTLRRSADRIAGPFCVFRILSDNAEVLHAVCLESKEHDHNEKHPCFCSRRRAMGRYGSGAGAFDRSRCRIRKRPAKSRSATTAQKACVSACASAQPSARRSETIPVSAFPSACCWGLPSAPASIRIGRRHKPCRCGIRGADAENAARAAGTATSIRVTPGAASIQARSSGLRTLTSPCASSKRAAIK